jgi:hypothetical protein
LRDQIHGILAAAGYDALHNGGTMKLIAVALLFAASTPAFAQVHTLSDSRNPQDGLEAKWQQTHALNNQHDTRSFDEKYPGATPGKKLDCSVSHDAGTNVNTITGCRYVPR